MDWDNYRYFLAVARSGSLSAAAYQLGISQPTASRRIEGLEQNLGVRLFDRSTEGLQLNRRGVNILNLVNEMEERTQSIQARITALDDALNGQVRLTVPEGLGTYWIPRHLKKINELFPNLMIEMQVCNNITNIKRREADIALRMGKPICDDLVGRIVGQVECGLYASTQYLEEHGIPLCLEELSDHDVIESLAPIDDLTQAKAFRKLIPHSNVVLSCSNIFTQLATANNGVGIVPLPNYMALESPNLNRVLTSEFAITIDLWVLTHEELRNTPRVRAVIDYISKAIKKDSVFRNTH